MIMEPHSLARRGSLVRNQFESVFGENKLRILLTGGAGYIGSHTALALLEQGHDLVCLDNLSNSRAEVMAKLERISGRAVPLIVADVRDTHAVEQIIREHRVESVIHFAGLKAVGESVSSPFAYYDNNVRGTLSLVEAMVLCDVKTLVFSSSATVYGDPTYLPLDERHPRSATNPYGRTKLIVEQFLEELGASDPEWRIALLRYFNPVGAHESGLIGEDPNGIPNNLMPFITRVAAGRLEMLSIFGGDYDTADGTGVRDYIHVMDLADGHAAALDAIVNGDRPVAVWNLGTGRGYSVLDVIEAFERVNGVSIARKVVDRRPGDVATCFASVLSAGSDLNWSARRGLEQMVESAWRFEKKTACVSS